MVIHSQSCELPVVFDRKPDEISGLPARESPKPDPATA
jgi:hypothetical protein